MKLTKKIDDIAREVKALALLLPDSMSKGHIYSTAARMGKFKGRNVTCWNCECKGHSVDDCPMPRDNDRILKNRQSFFQHRDATTYTQTNTKTKMGRFDDEPAIIMTLCASTIANLRGRSNSLWLDSGATHHVVNDASMLRGL